MVKNVFSRIDLSSFITGSTEHTWQPTMTSETNIPSYWLNWRFFVCAIFVLTSLFLSSYLIWRYEGPIKRKKRGDDQSLELEQLTGVVYDDESWNTSVKEIHPNWLLGFRVFGFVVLLGLISGNAIADGTGIFIFYTQWTFTLVTIYFGLGSLVSIYRFRSPDNGENRVSIVDEEQGTYRPPGNAENSNVFKSSSGHDRENMSTRQVATTLGYIHQILFQTCAGAVLLTDGVFWFIIYPFLTAKDFNLDFFIVIMHSVNAIFLLGETFLNSLGFILCGMDRHIRAISMDCSCLCLLLVALPILGFVIILCSFMVCGCWVDAHTMLWNICFDREVEALVALKMLLRRNIITYIIYIYSNG
ncbi:transmembrane protein [Arabidopsis thaliana]|uniref:Transmembrane protein n=1 Tax=Arabidopsis thaliana TaxID=3702 RepID=F4I5G9_ARATH|nr:uncharacterized protein AT1G70505 [Arabidopsis thaliana]AEE35072.1 transmembrane protein [Arabidopsis thaliana]|eukprot:NP_683487.4 transmembrane protein [Arabidopsis thaliana]